MNPPIRRVWFKPYFEGPRFDLLLHEAPDGLMTDHRVSYQLRSCGKPIFSGVMRVSPLHAIDSDDTVRAIMTFLTCRPGDVDAEYFKDYTVEQMEFVEDHAEFLANEVRSRFPEGA